MKLILIVFFLILGTNSISAQTKMDGKTISFLAHQNLQKSLTELREFLQLANNGEDPEQIRKNLEWCLQALKTRKFETSVLISNGVPYVYAKHMYDPKKPWILIYMQIDGQPTDDTNWDQPDPFKAELKQLKNEKWERLDWNQAQMNPDWRIFARSASDSKGPSIAFLSALDILAEKKIAPEFNIKLILDFQEEMGSPSLPELVLKNKELFQAKRLLIMDGTRHVSNLPTLTFGARGIVTITLKVFGAKTELHSGQYGNFAPNPALRLAQLIGGMTDDKGRVTIPGFYDGIQLSLKEKELINDMPGNDEDILRRIGIARADQVGETYEESLQYPSLNIRGLKAASVGKEARTVIPSEAIAEIDIRLVPESDGERLVSLIKNFIVSRGYHFVNESPTQEERLQYSNLISFQYEMGSKPFRTDLNSETGIWLSSAMDRTFGAGNYVKQRTTGGSQPIEPFITSLALPAVSIRIPNPDNNIHAANENLRIGNFVEGIQACLGILTEKLK